MRWASVGLLALLGCNSPRTTPTGDAGVQCEAAGGICYWPCPDCFPGTRTFEGFLWTLAPDAGQDCNAPLPPGAPPPLEVALCYLVAPADAAAGPFCAQDTGVVAQPETPSINVAQCTGSQPFCMPLVGAAVSGWGCCASPSLPDGGPPATNACTSVWDMNEGAP